VTTPGQWCFKIVAALADREPELKARFIGDALFLPVHSTQERWSLLQYLSMSVRSGDVIGVLFGEDNRILEIGAVVRAEVLEVGDRPQYPHLSCVELGGEGAPRYLAKQHSRYEQLLRQLTEAARTGAFVWCVLQGATIVDVKVLSPDDDARLCRWMQESAEAKEAGIGRRS
jgi:hypothetical protein